VASAACGREVDQWRARLDRRGGGGAGRVSWRASPGGGGSGGGAGLNRVARRDVGSTRGGGDSVPPGYNC